MLQVQIANKELSFSSANTLQCVSSVDLFKLILLTSSLYFFLDESNKTLFAAPVVIASLAATGNLAYIVTTYRAKPDDNLDNSKCILQLERRNRAMLAMSNLVVSTLLSGFYFDKSKYTFSMLILNGVLSAASLIVARRDSTSLLLNGMSESITGLLTVASLSSIASKDELFVPLIIISSSCIIQLIQGMTSIAIGNMHRIKEDASAHSTVSV